MHYLNATDAPITAHVTLNAYAYAEGTAYTQTAAYITYNSDINIAAGRPRHVESRDLQRPRRREVLDDVDPRAQAGGHDRGQGRHATWCSVEAPTGSTRARKTLDAIAVLQVRVEQDDVRRARTTTPATTRATMIHAGPSAQTNEMCMGTGYFFPATPRSSA